MEKLKPRLILFLVSRIFKKNLLVINTENWEKCQLDFNSSKRILVAGNGGTLLYVIMEL